MRKGCLAKGTLYCQTCEEECVENKNYNIMQTGTQNSNIQDKLSNEVLNKMMESLKEIKEKRSDDCVVLYPSEYDSKYYMAKLPLKIVKMAISLHKNNVKFGNDI